MAEGTSKFPSPKKTKMLDNHAIIKKLEAQKKRTYYPDKEALDLMSQ